MMNNSREDQINKKSPHNGQENKYLIFVLNDESYAIDITKVKEIKSLSSIEVIIKNINYPDYIIGISNIYNQIVPIIDLAELYQLPIKNKNDYKVVIFIGDKEAAGLLAEEVLNISSINSNQIRPISNILSSIKNNFINHFGIIDNNPIMIINTDKILSLNQIQNINHDSDKFTDMYDKND